MTDESLPLNSNAASATNDKAPAKIQNKAPVEEEKQPQKDKKAQKQQDKDQKPKDKDQKQKYNGPLRPPNMKDKYRVMRSNEEGYKGHSDNWFDLEKFNQPKKTTANFD